MRTFWIVLLAGVACAADLNSILAKWKPVQVPPPANLDAKERQLVEKLVLASRYFEGIYWQQGDPEALKLYETAKDPTLKRLLMINGSRYNLLDDNKPFVGTAPEPPGRNLYPAGMTRADIEKYVQAHPDQKQAIYDPYTIVRRKGDRLETIPYHVAFKTYLEPASKLLREASALTTDPKFAKFLTLRADALLSDDYYPSDLAWLDMEQPKIDVIFAPYETYLDGLLGVKTSVGAAVLIRNEAESAKLALYQKYVPDIQDALPIAAADRPSKKGQPSPMEVMDAPFRTGDLLHGYQSVADNLPNDARIHEAKGTKKIFFKNFMDARVNYVILPLAKQVMDPKQVPQATAEGYLAAVVLHEICHGLGPAFAHANGKQVDIRESIGPAYAGLEEAKADVVGMYGLKWLIDHKALDAARLPEYYASYVAGIFRTLRFGTGEAHGRAEMMEFNFLSEQKAITEQNGKYSVDYARMPNAIAALAKELLEIEATGDRKRAEAWMTRYDVMPPALSARMDAVKGVPVDIEPTFSWPVLPPQETR